MNINCIKNFANSCVHWTFTTATKRRNYLQQIIENRPLYIKDFAKFEEVVNQDYQKKIEIDNNEADKDFQEIHENMKKYAEKTWQLVILPNTAI